MNKLIIPFLVLMLVSCNAYKKDANNSQNKPERNSQAPMMGWSSWNNFEININEEIIKAQADAMLSSGLKEVGYSYVNIVGFMDKRNNYILTRKHFQRSSKPRHCGFENKGRILAL